MPFDDHLVTVGRFCSAAEGVLLIVSGRHCTNVGTFPFRSSFEGMVGPHADRRDQSVKGPITIESDVWLATRAMVLSGVTVGAGSVVAAGSVVTRSVPPYSLVAGNPARVVRYRFPQRTIDRLLELAWWDWPVEKVAACREDFYGSVEAFLEKHEG